MTHGDCASAGQCRLGRVEKSNGAVGVIAKYKLMLCFSFFFFVLLFLFAGGRIYDGDDTHQQQPSSAERLPFLLVWFEDGGKKKVHFSF